MCMHSRHAVINTYMQMNNMHNHKLLTVAINRQMSNCNDQPHAKTPSV